MIRKDFSNKKYFQGEFNRKRLILVHIWKKNGPGRKKNKCTGLKVRECLSHARKRKTFRVIDGMTVLNWSDIKGYSL